MFTLIFCCCSYLPRCEARFYKVDQDESWGTEEDSVQLGRGSGMQRMRREVRLCEKSAGTFTKIWAGGMEKSSRGWEIWVMMREYGLGFKWCARVVCGLSELDTLKWFEFWLTVIYFVDVPRIRSRLNAFYEFSFSTCSVTYSMYL